MPTSKNKRSNGNTAIRPATKKPAPAAKAPTHAVVVSGHGPDGWEQLALYQPGGQLPTAPGMLTAISRIRDGGHRSVNIAGLIEVDLGQYRAFKAEAVPVEETPAK